MSEIVRIQPSISQRPSPKSVILLSVDKATILETPTLDVRQIELTPTSNSCFKIFLRLLFMSYQVSISAINYIPNSDNRDLGVISHKIKL